MGRLVILDLHGARALKGDGFKILQPLCSLQVPCSLLSFGSLGVITHMSYKEGLIERDDSGGCYELSRSTDKQDRPSLPREACI